LKTNSQTVRRTARGTDRKPGDRVPTTRISPEEDRHPADEDESFSKAETQTIWKTPERQKNPGHRSKTTSVDGFKSRNGGKGGGGGRSRRPAVDPRNLFGRDRHHRPLRGHSTQSGPGRARIQN